MLCVTDIIDLVRIVMFTFNTDGLLSGNVFGTIGGHYTQLFIHHVF